MGPGPQQPCRGQLGTTLCAKVGWCSCPSLTPDHQDRQLKELFTGLEERVHHHNTKGDMLRSVCVELGLEIAEFDRRCVLHVGVTPPASWILTPRTSCVGPCVGAWAVVWGVLGVVRGWLAWHMVQVQDSAAASAAHGHGG